MIWNVYGHVQNPHGVDVCTCDCCKGENPRYVDRLVDAATAEQAIDKVNGLLHIKAKWLYGCPQVNLFSTDAACKHLFWYSSYGCPQVNLFSTDAIRAEEESVLVIG